MEMTTIPTIQLEKMQEELRSLRNTPLYKRLLEFEQNILKDKKYTRKDLGF